VVALSDSAGNTAEQYSYDVYGAVLVRDADGRPLAVSLLANPYFFTARRFDTLTGLYYYRARYYSPKIGRFEIADCFNFRIRHSLLTETRRRGHI
jgi:RHS repeat-associated protein